MSTANDPQSNLLPPTISVSSSVPAKIVWNNTSHPYTAIVPADYDAHVSLPINSQGQETPHLSEEYLLQALKAVREKSQQAIVIDIAGMTDEQAREHMVELRKALQDLNSRPPDICTHTDGEPEEPYTGPTFGDMCRRLAEKAESASSKVSSQEPTHDGRTVTIILFDAEKKTTSLENIYHGETDFSNLHILTSVDGELCLKQEGCRWCDDLRNKMREHYLKADCRCHADDYRRNHPGTP